MIESIWIQNQYGDSLELNLRTSEKDSGITIFNMEGLGSPVTSVNSSGGPGFDGVVANSINVDPRSINLTLAIPTPGVTEATAKGLVYRHFPIKTPLRLGVETTDIPDVYIDCYVENSEFNQFSKVENVVISLLCPNPYFVEVYTREFVIGDSWSIPLFSFPFSNESLTDSLIDFGMVSDVPVVKIDGQTEVDTGCDVVLYFGGYVQDVQIANSNGSQVMDVDMSDAEAHFGSAVQDGDILRINTRVGEKSVTFVRDSEEFNLINGVDIDGDWIDVRAGLNYISFSADIGIDLLSEAVVRFNPLRLGV